MICAMFKNVLGVIPARLASTRFPGKLLKKINGKPLIQLTYENACASHRLESVIIATDSQEIAEAAEAFGAEVIMTSDRCLNGTERIIEAFHSSDRLRQADAIVNIQGDEPLLESSVIDAVVDCLERDHGAAVSTALIPLTDPERAQSTSTVKAVFDLNHYALYFSRSLIPGNKKGIFIPDIKYYQHLGIYAYRTSFLPEYAKMETTPLQEAEDLEQLKILERGYNMKITVVTSQSIGVDTPEDFKKVEKILCKKNTSSSQAESARP